MLIFRALCILSCGFLLTNNQSTHGISHPTRFTNLSECSDRNMPVTHLLEEPDSTQWIVRIPNGIVINAGAIVTDDGFILEDSETYKPDQQRLLKGRRNIAEEESVFFDGKLVVIASPGQENWYHWLLQVLPRLKIVAESGIAYDKIYVSCIPYAWQQESLRIVLEKLNIPLDAILITHTDSIIQAQELIVPSVPFIPSRNRQTLPNWLTTFLHDCFLPDIDGDAPQKIYISRSNASLRRIINEAALTQLLKDKGFVIVHLEKMPIYEQARYFNQASIIIGPHGSGFANLIFSQPNTTIIEIDNSLMGEGQRGLYELMSTLMHCSYYPFYVDVTTEEHLDDDLFVDIEAFAQFLDTVTIR